MLELHEVTAAYGESRVLKRVSLSVPQGKLVCLMGRNGVGKTTLLQTVVGLMPALSGRVHFQGREITAVPTWERARSGIGYVPQGRGIFPFLTVQENLLIGQEASARRDYSAVEEALAMFPILKRFFRRPGGALSGGQQQQLAIARALVGKPSLLLLDEPTEGIQPSIVWEIEDVIGRLKAGGHVSILLVEQFVDFALSLADHYYVMEKGSIVAHGETADTSKAELQEYLTV